MQERSIYIPIHYLQMKLYVDDDAIMVISLEHFILQLPEKAFY